MKKFIILTFTAVLLLSVMSTLVFADRGYEYTAAYATPFIDGIAGDEWELAEWTEVDLPFISGYETTSSLSVKVLHDSEYIYFLAKVVDYTPNRNDAIEFYVDEDYCRNDYYCDFVTQLSILSDGSPWRNPASLSMSDADSVVEAAFDGMDGEFFYEWAFKPLNGIPAGESVMGLEFMYNDCNEKGVHLTAYRWNVDTASGETAPFQSVAHFGKMILAAAPEGVETKAPATKSETEAPATEAATEAVTEAATEAVTEAETKAETEAAKEPAVTEAETDSADGEEGENGSGTVIVIVAAVVAAAAIAAIAGYIVMKKRK